MPRARRERPYAWAAATAPITAVVASAQPACTVPVSSGSSRNRATISPHWNTVATTSWLGSKT